MDLKEVKNFSLDWKNWDLQGSKAFFLTIDLSYPKILHDSHNDLPLCVEKKTIMFEEFSDYTKHLLRSMGEVVGKEEKFSTEKLVATFNPKYEYCCHWKLLALFLELGMKVDRVHSIMEFTQKDFVSSYIRRCIDARRAAKNKFQKQL